MEASLKLNKKHMPKEMPDIQQQEQFPSILIIYRDNALFEKYVPEIARILQAKGREVEIKNFPRGTEKDEIKEWYDENLGRLAGMEMISDMTANPFLRGFKKLVNISLDNLIYQAITQIVFGEGEGCEIMNDSLDQSSQLKEFFTTIIKNILKNQENVPNKIYIFSDHILSHHQDYWDAADENKEELKKAYSEKIKELLIESGIDAEKIIIKLEKLSQKEFQEEVDQLGNWVIADRHSPISMTGMINAKNLQLPTGSFYSSAREAGLIDIPEEEFSQNLEKVIDEKLGS